MSHVPPLTKPKIVPGDTNWPTSPAPRCGQTVGTTIWPGHHGQRMVACSLPLHREDVESQDAPYRTAGSAVLEFGERARHEYEEDQREQSL
jgi:hypothetical protein